MQGSYLIDSQAKKKMKKTRLKPCFQVAPIKAHHDIEDRGNLEGGITQISWKRYFKNQT